MVMPMRLRLTLIVALAIAGISLGLFIVSAHEAEAQSSAVTDEITPGNFPTVSVKCRLTVNADNSLENKCGFKNKTADAQRFVFCNMLGLKSTIPNSSVRNRPHFRLENIMEGGVDKLKCRRDGSVAGPFQSGWHFACKVVNVPAGVGQTADVTFTSTDSPSGNTTYSPPAGTGITTLRADQFTVQYADIVKIPAGKSLVDLESSCNDANGQDNFLTPQDATSWWSLQKLPFKDPFVRFQPIDPSTEPPPKQYALFDDTPCAPEGFPLRIAELPPCKVSELLPPMSVDLNLFDWFTMSAEEPTEAYLTVETEEIVPDEEFTVSAEPEGIAVDTVPPPLTTFLMPGGGELFGRLTVSADETVEEGRRLRATVNVFDAVTDELIFGQTGLFCQDSEPPEVIAHSAQFDPLNNLLVELTAVDATTSPIHATLWFSVDSVSWHRVSLAPATDILDEIPQRTFSGKVGPFPPGTKVQYFIAVQDLPFNVTYFGVGEAVVRTRREPPRHYKPRHNFVSVSGE